MVGGFRTLGSGTDAGRAWSVSVVVGAEAPRRPGGAQTGELWSGPGRAREVLQSRIY